MTQTLASRVRRIIADELGADIDDLPDHLTFNTLGATDVQMIHVVMSVEDLVEAEATDDEAEKVKTVGDLIKLAEQLSSGVAVAA